MQCVQPKTPIFLQHRQRLVRGHNNYEKVGLVMTRQLLTERQIAKLLSVSVKTVQWWRWSGGGPPYLKLNSAVRYDPEKLAAWLDECKRTSTADQGTP